MPRNMSFAMTTDAIRARTKTVTRRLGWAFLRKGDILNACVKCQGLKKGERVERICQIRVVSVTVEFLADITQDDVTREGFPRMDRHEFIARFCRGSNVKPYAMIRRIEFEYVD